MFISGILGHPLKKPRSIKIWNAYFRRKKISCKMYKFDILPHKLDGFFKKIKQDNKFKAMAVTMPYKKTVFTYLDRVDEYAKKTQAINLIVKKKNKIIGYNTDIYGALKSIKKELKKYKRIIIIGLGGTGQAIFNFLRINFKKKDYYLISKKYKTNSKNKKIKIFRSLTNDILFKSSLIINCTPIGSDLNKSFLNRTPISIKLFEKINLRSFVFDVIYSPKETLLSKICKKKKIKYLNGLKMNSLQAIRALELAFGK